MNNFISGFIKGVKETPLAYFAPIIAIWQLLVNATDEVLKP